MTIKYIGDLPDEDGIYLVRVDGELTVAEAQTYGEGGGEPMWAQLGIDYDAWSHGSEVVKLEVITKLGLEMIEQITKQGYYFVAEVERKPN